ncbi:type II secretion system F family protein [Candidatus Woesearchaeota archaeon]|nr:type II secretion system F family protein [Candidatus Woesearchaeota archaeon]
MEKFTTKLVQRITSFYPNLKRDIRIAHLPDTPTGFVYNNLKFSLPFSLGLTVLFFFIADKAGISLIVLPFVFVIVFFLVFNFAFFKIKGLIATRQKEIDREVLFAGQYLLIKLYSGKPLLNALIDTTKSYGVASKYIKEIVEDIDTGSPIEVALQSAMNYSPSAKLRKILFHINNSLKLGIDVTRPLSSVLQEITKEQEIEIKRYGKKLNTIVLFYMLGAIVIPSIGMTLFIIMSSFINFSITSTHFVVALFFIIVIEFLFISVFRTIRPTVNL